MNILVLGKAKTGTTVISRTIHNSLGEAGFHMEPKQIEFFMKEKLPHEDDHVVKIIFEHWDKTPNVRRAFTLNELPLKFDKKVAIVRDPRDELLSRMMYIIYPWLEKNKYRGNEKKVADWLSFVAGVESNPVDYSFLDLVSRFDQIFGVKILQNRHRLTAYFNFCKFLGDRAFLIRYEDFISGNVSDLEAYLGFDIANESGIEDSHRTRRSANFNNWKAIFKEDDVTYFKSNFGDLFEQYGYTDWELEPATTLPSEHYSGYLLRIVQNFSG